MILDTIIHAITDVIHHVAGFIIDATFFIIESVMNFWLGGGNFDAEQHKLKRDAAQKALSDKFFKERFDNKNQTPPSKTVKENAKPRGR